MYNFVAVTVTLDSVGGRASSYSVILRDQWVLYINAIQYHGYSPRTKARANIFGIIWESKERKKRRPVPLSTLKNRATTSAR